MVLNIALGIIVAIFILYGLQLIFVAGIYVLAGIWQLIKNIFNIE